MLEHGPYPDVEESHIQCAKPSSTAACNAYRENGRETTSYSSTDISGTSGRIPFFSKSLVATYARLCIYSEYAKIKTCFLTHVRESSRFPCYFRGKMYFLFSIAPRGIS